MDFFKLKQKRFVVCCIFDKCISYIKCCYFRFLLHIFHPNTYEANILNPIYMFKHALCTDHSLWCQMISTLEYFKKETSCMSIFKHISTHSYTQLLKLLNYLIKKLEKIMTTKVFLTKHNEINNNFHVVKQQWVTFVECN